MKEKEPGGVWAGTKAIIIYTDGSMRQEVLDPKDGYKEGDRMRRRN